MAQDELSRDHVGAFVSRLPPTVLVGQRGFRPSVRTTVGTATGFLSVLRRLFVLASRPYSEQARRTFRRLGLNPTRGGFHATTVEASKSGPRRSAASERTALPRSNAWLRMVFRMSSSVARQMLPGTANTVASFRRPPFRG